MKTEQKWWSDMEAEELRENLSQLLQLDAESVVAAFTLEPRGSAFAVTAGGQVYRFSGWQMGESFAATWEIVAKLEGPAAREVESA